MTTEDGYILELHRIPGPKADACKENGASPLPGKLCVSSTTFIVIALTTMLNMC